MIDLSPSQQFAVKEAVSRLWHEGAIRYKLDLTQLSLYESAQTYCYRGKKHGFWVAECARKLGKSYLAVVIALEACLKNPGQRVNYACPTAKEAYEIVEPLIRQICEDAPEECKPKFNSQTGHITFPRNGPAKGAYIVLFGCEDEMKADRGRGPSAVLNIIDEAAFVNVLRYTVRSILKPQTLRTGGPTIMFSTPPKSPGHEFIEFANAAEAIGAYEHRTIYQNGMMTKEEVDQYILSEAVNAGLTIEEFKQTTDFRREFLAERVVDEALAVVPEFSLREKEIVKAVPRPVLYDVYEGFDWGMSPDPSAMLFGFYHFELAAFVVEDEILLLGGNTDELAKVIKAKEALLYPRTGKKPRLDSTISGWGSWNPLLRVCDTDKRLVADMQMAHGLSLYPTKKDDKQLQVNKLRRWVGGKRLFIHPRCKNLIRQMKETIWNRPRTEFERLGGHHGDLVDALIYIVRNVRENSNPIPAFYAVNEDHAYIPEKEAAPGLAQYEKLLRAPWDEWED